MITVVLVVGEARISTYIFFQLKGNCCVYMHVCMCKENGVKAVLIANYFSELTLDGCLMSGINVMTMVHVSYIFL